MIKRKKILFSAGLILLAVVGAPIFFNGKAHAATPGFTYLNDVLDPTTLLAACHPKALEIKNWTKNNVDYRLLQLGTETSVDPSNPLINFLNNKDCYFGPVAVTTKNAGTGIPGISSYFTSNGRAPTYARLGFGGDMPEATQPAQPPINNRSIKDNPREYYGNGNGVAGGFVDDGAWVKINGKTVICQGIDDPSAPLCQPIVTPNQGNAGHLFVEDNCPGGITGYKDLVTASNPTGFVQCQDADTYNWYRPYIGSPELTNKSIFAQDPVTHEIKDFNVEFYVRNTQPAGFNSAFFVVIGFARCDDGSLPPGGDYTLCPGGVPTPGGPTDAPCPNYTAGLNYTVTGPNDAPTGLNGFAITSITYNHSISINSGQIDAGSSSSPTGNVPVNKIPNIYKDANIYPVSGTASVTYSYQYISGYNPGGPITDDTGKIIGYSEPTPIFASVGPIAGSATIQLPSSNPDWWPNSKIGCYTRHFHIQNDATIRVTLNSDLSPDPEEPTAFTTNGQVRVDLSVDKDPSGNQAAVSASYPLIVHSTPRIAVTGSRPGSDSVDATFKNQTYPLNTIVDRNNPAHTLRTSWDVKTPPKGGDIYCATITVTKAKGDMDVFGDPTRIDKDTETVTNPCKKVVDRPYVKAFNSDVRAKNIKTWTRAVSIYNGFRGSSVQFAAMIMNGGLLDGDTATKGFYTASRRDQAVTAPYPCASTGLLFSNTSTITGSPSCPANAGWGGTMTADFPLLDEWWTSTAPAAFPNSGGAKAINLGARLGSGDTYLADGQGVGPCGSDRRSVNGQPEAQCFKLSGGPSDIIIPRSKHFTLYVNGDLQIDKNICYVGPTCGSVFNYNNIEEMPYFTVIVKGSIFIDKDVTQLDGLYIALDNPVIGQDTTYKPGTIYTCTKDFKAPQESGFDAAAVITNCNKRLQINGAVIAQNAVEFWRIKNSLRDSKKGDQSSIVTSNTTCTLGSSPGGTNCAAEEVNFIPELILGTPAFSGTNSGLDLDSFTGLPPIF